MASPHYDVVVGGGSVGGLSFAGEAAANGLSVLVLEEDSRIGEPEKCDGLVSLKALGEYIGPAPSCIQSTVERATIFAPSGGVVSLDASRMGVIVIDRSAYEEQLAEAAATKGAVLKTGVRVSDVSAEGTDGLKVAASSATTAAMDRYTCSYYVDATGPSSVMRRNRAGLIPAAKYELEGDWFTEGEVEVYLDQTKYPGFFAWVIPRGRGLAKVGVAGTGINTFRLLDSFLGDRKFLVRSRVAAPIYVGGPVEDFVVGHTVYVGESAGQVKPTTAGGILGSVAAGVIAGRRMAESIQARDPAVMLSYQEDWEQRFGKEFRLMKRLRHLYRQLSNADLDKMVTALSSPRISERLSASDFDFHGSALLSALGPKLTLQLAALLVSAEAKRALASLVQ